MNPPNRIRQHNGEKVGGAKRTARCSACSPECARFVLQVGLYMAAVSCSAEHLFILDDAAHQGA